MTPPTRVRAMSISPVDLVVIPTALELASRTRQVAREGEDLDFRVLVDRVALVGRQRDHVAVRVRTPVDVVRVQEERGVRRAVALDATVQNHVGADELQRVEARFALLDVSEALIGLKAGE